MDNVLVSGGAGYIGAHACKLLTRAGFRPVTFDNLSTGWRAAVRFGPLVDWSGNPTSAQIALYRRWAQGGAGLILVGEVQGDPRFAENPGNLFRRDDADLDAFRELPIAGSQEGAQLWLQLGHAGVMAYPPSSKSVH